MADCGNPVKRRKVALERNAYGEVLERIANFVEKELDNGRVPLSRPDDTEWRLQRVYTIQTLNKFREKLGVRPKSEKAVGNSTKNEEDTNSVIGTVKTLFTRNYGPWITTIGNRLTSSPLVTDIGNVVNYIGTSIGGVSNQIEGHISVKYLREIEAALEEDRTLTRPLAEWLNSSNELDSNVQAIFGVSLTSGSFNTVIKVFHAICKHSNSIRDFDDIISLLEQGKYSVYIGNDIQVEKLEKFYQCVSSSPQLADRISRILSTLSTQPEDVQICVDGIRAHRSVMGISSSSAVPTAEGGLSPEVPTAGKSSDFCVFQTIRLAISIISFINAASIIRNGTSQYSDALKELTRSLAWELERMENL